MKPVTIETANKEIRNANKKNISVTVRHAGRSISYDPGKAEEFAETSTPGLYVISFTEGEGEDKKTKELAINIETLPPETPSQPVQHQQPQYTQFQAPGSVPFDVYNLTMQKMYESFENERKTFREAMQRIEDKHQAEIDKIKQIHEAQLQALRDRYEFENALTKKNFDTLEQDRERLYNMARQRLRYEMREKIKDPAFDWAGIEKLLSSPLGIAMASKFLNVDLSMLQTLNAVTKASGNTHSEAGGLEELLKQLPMIEAQEA